MNYTCKLVDRPAQPALSVRTRVAVQMLPQVLGQNFGKIAGYLSELGQAPAGAPYVAYFNMDMQNLDIEIGFPTAAPIEGRGEIQPSQLPGRGASCMHIGPYNQIEPAYKALSTWIEQNNHQPSGAAYEIYLNDPNETPPEALQTLILFPLQD